MIEYNPDNMPKFKVTPRPSLGIMPRYLWEEQRFEDVRDAILNRIRTGGHPVPPEWIEEYNELIKKVK